MYMLKPMYKLLFSKENVNIHGPAHDDDDPLGQKKHFRRQKGEALEGMEGLTVY